MRSIVVLLLGFVRLIFPTNADAATDYNEVNNDGSFSFGLSNDDIGGHYHSASGSADKIVRGRYGSRNPANGRIEETVYSAGPRGYRARGPQIHRKMDLSQYPRGPVGSPDDPLADPYDDPSYNFEFKTVEHDRRENSDSTGRVRGLYSYLDDIGERHTVRYAAGAGTGFEVLNSVPDSPASVAYSSPLYKAPAETRGRMAVQRGPDGQYKFILSGPDQRRSESSGPDGLVRGSYSYLDDKGIQRTVQYIAGAGIGYRVIQSTVGIGSHLVPRPALSEYGNGIRDLQSNNLAEDGYLHTAESGSVIPKDRNSVADNRGTSRDKVTNRNNDDSGEDDSKFYNRQTEKSRDREYSSSRGSADSKGVAGSSRNDDNYRRKQEENDYKDRDEKYNGHSTSKGSSDRRSSTDSINRGRATGRDDSEEHDIKPITRDRRPGSTSTTKLSRDRDIPGRSGSGTGSTNRSSFNRNGDSKTPYLPRDKTTSDLGKNEKDQGFESNIRNKGTFRKPIDRGGSSGGFHSRGEGTSFAGGSSLNSNSDNGKSIFDDFDNEFPPLISNDHRRLNVDREKDWSVRGRDSTIIKNVGKWFIGLPPGAAVRAHVQNIDLLPLNGRIPSPSEALRRDEQTKN